MNGGAVERVEARLHVGRRDAEHGHARVRLDARPGRPSAAPNTPNVDRAVGDERGAVPDGHAHVVAAESLRVAASSPWRGSRSSAVDEQRVAVRGRGHVRSRGRRRGGSRRSARVNLPGPVGSRAVGLLDGKTAIVTGGGGGIGRGSRSGSPPEGAAVTIAEIDARACRRRPRRRSGRPAGRVEPVVADVREAGDVDRVVAAALDESGGSTCS